MRDYKSTFDPLLMAFIPHLDKLGFGQSELPDDDNRTISFARVRPNCVQRLGLGIEKNPDKQGKWNFEVVCGVEYHALEREKFWQMLPGTHVVNLLRLWLRRLEPSVRISPKCFYCDPKTDWQLLAKQLSDWSEKAFEVIDRDSEAWLAKRAKIKEDHLKQIRHRLKKSSDDLASARGGLKNGLPWNIFAKCLSYLKSEASSWETLDSVAECDPRSAVEKEQYLEHEFQRITKLLDDAIFKGDSATGDNAILPVNHVRVFSIWNTPLIKLFVAIRADSDTRRAELILGCTDNKMNRPIPRLEQLSIPRQPKETNMPAKKKSTTKKADRKADRILDKVKKLLESDTETFVELDCWSFEDDADAFDESIINEYYDQATGSFENALRTLSDAFGSPAIRSQEEQDEIPRCGIMDCAIWDVEKHRLYLAWLHEDRELPIELIVGVAAPPKKVKRVTKAKKTSPASGKKTKRKPSK